ncbi:MAG: LysR family transcriptional regulator, partial [Myxococcales bacterium]|nr:LysR family transcriptional regulator [Myxococcales bacterium]
MDWRDLRIALALERHQSLAAAGRALGVDPTTVGRRIAVLEAGLGAALFVRAGEGWRPTEAGQRVVAHAAEMARQVRALGHAVGAV